MASLTTAATRDGRPVDLLDPAAASIDFDEIAYTLANINRFAGAFEKPISVAQHTLIAIDAAPFTLKPWVALHDAHEAFIGDITRPTVSAISCIAGSMTAGGGDVVRCAIDELRRRLDEAIHAAAGLPLPSPQQARMIADYDAIALSTERRDYLARPLFSWGRIDHVPPAPRRYGFLPPHETGTKLAHVFRTLLPSLSDRRPR